MITLSNLNNTTRPKKKIQRVGRGQGSGRGKTSCRGEKGDKSRSGYKRRYGKEGGQLPLFRKLPCRGFSNAQFANESYAINLRMLEQLYTDGETVNLETLRQKGCLSENRIVSLKILADGELTKKVSIEAHAFSEAAREKLEKAKISMTIVPFLKSES
jgi:large subunit ribosomal protein L15